MPPPPSLPPPHRLIPDNPALATAKGALLRSAPPKSSRLCVPPDLHDGCRGGGGEGDAIEVSTEILPWAASCRDADEISLKNLGQEHVLSCGHGFMVDGYYPVIQVLAQGLDILLDQRVKKIARQHNGVMVIIYSDVLSCLFVFFV
ncbi:hypothetical protein ZWY2020_040056 [Hordeum vulgare]|nr:hypothetical protein ZWY2020_040056 [Hordeum vulgare]